MNDLLTDSFVNDAKRGETDIEMGTRVTTPRSNPDTGMDAFNKQIQEIDKQVDKVVSLLQKFKDANEESKSVTMAAAMKAIKKQMEKDVDEVGKIARNVKAKIEALNNEVFVTKGSLINVLHLTLRQKIQEVYREVVKRRVITVTGTRPDEEVSKNKEVSGRELILQVSLVSDKV